MLYLLEIIFVDLVLDLCDRFIDLIYNLFRIAFSCYLLLGMEMYIYLQLKKV